MVVYDRLGGAILVARPRSTHAGMGDTVTNAGTRPETRRAGSRPDPSRIGPALGIPACIGLAAAIVIAGSTYAPGAIVLAFVASLLIVAIPLVPAGFEVAARRFLGVLLAGLDRRAGGLARGGTRLTAALLGAVLVATVAIALRTDAPARGALVGLALLAAGALVVRVPVRPVSLARDRPHDHRRRLAHRAAHPVGQRRVVRRPGRYRRAARARTSPYTACWPGRSRPVSTMCAFPYLPMSSFALVPFRPPARRHSLRAARGAPARLRADRRLCSPPRLAVLLALLPVPLASSWSIARGASR